MRSMSDQSSKYKLEPVWRCSKAHGLVYQTFGVADGHGGAGASDLVQQSLPDKVNELLAAGMDVQTAYTLALQEVEASFRNLAGDSGAGACVVSATIAGPYIWCANLGDCRCAVVRLMPPDPVVQRVDSYH
eukprot:2825174-Amphidinium_carterae.1